MTMKMIKYIKLRINLLQDSYRLKRLIADSFKKEFNIPKAKIRVRLWLTNGDGFCGKKSEFGVMRLDNQNGCWVKSFLSFRQYYKMRKELFG